MLWEYCDPAMSSLILHVIKLILTVAESSNVFVDPMLERPPKELALVATVKSYRAQLRRWPVVL